jgi:hypothetical protein
MTERAEHQLDLPAVEIVDEDPPAGYREAAEVGLADHAAGRYVVCAPETFDRLLADAANYPQAS